jgi:hypothetical protein
LNLLRLALCPKIWSILEKVPWTVERICITWLLGEILCWYQPCLFDLMWGVVVKFLCWSFAEWPIYWWQWGIHTISMLGSICALRAIRVFFNGDGCPCVWCIYV